MKILDEVRAGSRRTLDPSLSVLTLSEVCVVCSATRGEMLLLKPPVPTPMMMMEIKKSASEPFS